MGAFERALILTGPTACGKSALALELAHRVGGLEIVSADAMVVGSAARLPDGRFEVRLGGGLAGAGASTPGSTR